MFSFLKKMLDDYDEIIRPTLGFSKHDTDKWKHFLEDSHRLLGYIKELLTNKMPRSYDRQWKSKFNVERSSWPDPPPFNMKIAENRIKQLQEEFPALVLLPLLVVLD